MMFFVSVDCTIVHCTISHCGGLGIGVIRGPIVVRSCVLEGNSHKITSSIRLEMGSLLSMELGTLTM